MNGRSFVYNYNILSVLLQIVNVNFFFWPQFTWAVLVFAQILSKRQLVCAQNYHSFGNSCTLNQTHSLRTLTFLVYNINVYKLKFLKYLYIHFPSFLTDLGLSINLFTDSVKSVIYLLININKLYFI